MADKKKATRKPRHLIKTGTMSLRVHEQDKADAKYWCWHTDTDLPKEIDKFLAELARKWRKVPANERREE